MVRPVAGPPQTDDKSARSTVLIIGKGELMDAALRLALDRHGLHVEETTGDPKTAVMMTAPDLVLLVGDAARDGGRAVLDKLGGGSGSAASVPVAVLGAPGALDARMQAFRHGAVAVVPRTASVDAIATRVAALVKEVQDRQSQGAEELGEATFDELVDLVSRELRSGILSVQGKDGEAMRIVLGAGRPVADAVEEFVRRMRPLVSRAEPLTYEIHSPTGGAVGLLDAEPGQETDPSLLEGLRVLLVDTDPARADAIAQELRARKVVVSVADASGRGLERARGLDPEVVILDAAGIEGPGFEVVRAIRRDVRLRWASMLVAPWEDIWPTPESTPDVARLAERIAPLVENDRALRARVANEAAFDARLESTGPCRFLRILATAPSPVHATFRSRAAVVEVDVAEGLVVGASGSRGAGDTLESVRAIAALLAMGAARVHVERRANPTVANLMAPVEEALARAAEEVSPIPVSQPPPKGAEKTSFPVRRRPFPAANELKAQGGAPQPEEELDSIVGLPRGIAASAFSNPSADQKDLSWSETDDPAEPPSRQELAKSAFSTAVPGAVPRPVVGKSPAATAAFGVPVVKPPEKPIEKTTVPGEPVVPPSRAPAPRKPTLAMGGPALGLPRSAFQVAPPPRAQVAPATNRNPTVTMGSAPPPADAAAPPPPVVPPAPAVPKRIAPKKTLLGVATTLPRPGASSVPPPPVVSEPAPPTSLSFEVDPGRITPELAPGVGVPSEPAPPGATTASLSDGLAALLEPGGDGRGDLGSLGELPDSADATDPLLDGIPSDKLDVLGLPRELPAPSGFGATPPPSTMGSGSGASSGFGASPPAAPLAPPVAAPPVAASPVVAAAVAVPPVVGPPISAAPPPAAAPRSGARTFGWLVVLAGLGAVVLVGGVLGWIRFGGGSLDQLLAMVGAGGTTDGDGISTTPLPLPDVGIVPVVTVPPSVPDAGVAVVVVAPAAIDAGAPVAPSALPDAGAPVAPSLPDAGPPVVDEPDEVAPPVIDGEETAASLVARAEALPPGSATAAEALYRQALVLDSREHHAMINLAELLMETGRAAEAIPLIENAIARRRTRASYRVLLGDARRDTGDASGAAAAWREALELEPDNRAARSRLGE